MHHLETVITDVDWNSEIEYSGDINVGHFWQNSTWKMNFFLQIAWELNTDISCSDCPSFHMRNANVHHNSANFLKPANELHFEVILNLLKLKKCGYDKIPIALIKKCIDIEKPFSTILINLSIETGTTPEALENNW